MKKNILDRICSIIKTHSILFDSQYLGLAIESKDSYDALLDFDKSQDNKKINRIISILRLHLILINTGILNYDADAVSEINTCILYLSSKLSKEQVTLKKSSIVPKNLGLSFVRNKLGVPLFGYYRPSNPPTDNGFILCYQAIQANGKAIIFASHISSKTSVSYSGLGIELTSTDAWYYSIIAEKNISEQSLPHQIKIENLVPHYFSKHIVYMANKKTRTKFKSMIFDPYHYQYAYFFRDDDKLKNNLRYFLLNILSGLFSVPEATAITLIDSFIEKSL